MRKVLKTRRDESKSKSPHSWERATAAFSRTECKIGHTHRKYCKSGQFPKQDEITEPTVSLDLPATSSKRQIYDAH